MSELSDKQLAEMCRRGERQAYTALVSRYSERVFAICLGILGNVHDAEDLAQEALLKGFRQIDRLRDKERFAPWIAVIARNLCLDFLRRKKREQAALAREDRPPPVTRNENPRLWEAIGRLSAAYRLPLLLYYFDGQSVNGVAEILNLTGTNVRTRLSRARRELRTTLADSGGRP